MKHGTAIQIAQHTPLSLFTNLLFLLALGFGQTATASIIYDFDDGTLQGWALSTDPASTTGVLQLFNIGGNPQGYLGSRKVAAGIGGIFAQAPAEISGDLRIFQGINWDDLTPFPPGARVGATLVVVAGVDGTVITGSWTQPAANTWTSNFLSFSDPTAWVVNSGPGNFHDAISNARALFINLDGAGGFPGSIESGIDNVTFREVPTPGSFFLLVAGLGLLVTQRRRKNTQ